MNTKPRGKVVPIAPDPGIQTVDIPMVVRQLPVEQIDTSLNPRKAFDPEAIATLAASIALHGILQPLVVTQLTESGPIILIAGERRLRAAIAAGLDRVPVVFRRMTDIETVGELALMENIQRQDLNPIEEAIAIEQLLSHGRSQTELAKTIGRSQSNISKRLALLALPETVKELVQTGALGPALATAIQAKWGRWPAVAAAVAAAAVEKQLKAADVEGGAALTMIAPADQKALTRSLENYSEPTIATCKGCPASGFVSEADWRGYCLNTTCYDEKRAIGKAANADKLARIQATGNAAWDAAGNPPKIESLKGAMQIYNTPPAGCTTACPCRKTAWAYVETVETCSDQKRYQELQETERVARADAAKEMWKRLGSRLKTYVARLNGGEALHSAAIAVIAARILGEPPAANAEAAESETLAKCLIAVLSEEIGRIHDWRPEAPLSEWFLDLVGAEEAPADPEPVSGIAIPAE